MGETSIEWCDKVWNPVTGCRKVSEGCRNCYAERVFPRAYGSHNVPIVYAAEELAVDPFRQPTRKRKFTDVQVHHYRLEQPLHWRKPSRIFVNSMSDLFHEDVPFEFIDKVFAVMALTPQHTFQVLTKRPERMREYCDGLTNPSGGKRLAVEILTVNEVYVKGLALCGRTSQLYDALTEDGGSCLPLPNVWLGVSVEDRKTYLSRALQLSQTPAAVRFLSVEPLLESIGGLMLDGIYQGLLHWVIIGGESGPNARPFNLQWARDVIRQCQAAGVACFMKQLGRNPYEAPNGNTPHTTGPDASLCKLYELDIDKGHGGDPTEWPADLRVREFPEVRQ